MVMGTDAEGMSFWKPGVHDTAKLPAAYRRMVLFQARNLLERLIDLRDVALEHATDEALQHYASVFPLPPPDEEEEEDLDDSSEESDSDEDEDEDVGTYEDQLAQREAAHMGAAQSLAALNQQGNDAFTGDTDTNMEDSEPVWDGAIHGFDWPNVEEPSEYESASSDEESEVTDEATLDPFEAVVDTDTPELNTWLTNTPGAPYRIFCNTFVTFPVSSVGDDKAVLSTGIEYSDVPQGPASTWLTNNPNTPNGAPEAGVSSETWSEGTASLSADHCIQAFQDSSGTREHEEFECESDSSDEITSQTMDNEIDKLRLAPSTLLHPYLWYWPTYFLDEIVTEAEKYEEYLQKKKALVTRLSGSKGLPQADIDNLLCEFVQENIVYKPIVNAAQLFKLKRFIDNVVRFILPIQKNINTIDAEMNEGRRRHYLPPDSPLRLRSKRLGSSLRFVTSVDEEWGMVLDNWGMPPVKKKRQQIQVWTRQKWMAVSQSRL